jgi:signal transduction histidine kinase
MKWLVMAALMIVTFLVLVVQDLPLSSYLESTERDHIVTGLERDAFVLAGRSEEALESNDLTGYGAVTALARKYRSAGGARVIIVNSQGIAIFTSDQDDSEVGASYSSRPEIATALTGRISTGTRYSQTLKVELLYVAVPALSGTAVDGAVRLTFPESVVTDAVNARLRLLVVAALTSLLLAAIVGLILASTITRSLSRLRAVTELIADGALGERADERGGAYEMRSLAHSFNVMATRVHTVIERQRQFSADASHQLRTPLTALRLRLERARELVSTDAAAAAERLAAAEVEVDRLGTIIEGLLLLSRADAESTELISMDVAAIARARVDEWQSLAQESQIHLTVKAPARAMVLAADTTVDQILDNYLDNALAASPPGSTIRVVVAVDGEEVSLSVLDEGPGLSDEDASRAFDRFWRKSSASAGNGLGLAIVAQLAAVSGGTVGLARRPAGGMVAYARLPADTAP